MAQGKMTATDDEIVSWMRDIGDPAYTTGELAKQFDMTSEGMRGRLEDLEEEERLMSKKASRRTILWWLPECYDSSAFS